MKMHRSTKALLVESASDLATTQPAAACHEPGGGKNPKCQAFTLTELVVVIAVLLLLGSLSLTAMSGSKASSQAVSCVDNVQQLTRAWQMYATDHNGKLAGNGDEGNQGGGEAQWAKGVLTYAPDYADNTNINNLVLFQPIVSEGGELGNYLNHDFRVFKCPSDPVLSSEGGQKYPRVRSVSMNGWINGARWALTWDYGGFVAYTMAAIVNPSPADTWILRDERPDSINDGFFAVGMVNAEVVSMPASYHFGGSAQAFADGHAEIHVWKTAPFTRQDVNSTKWSITWGGASLPNNVDREWLQLHSGQFSNAFTPIP